MATFTPVFQAFFNKNSRVKIEISENVAYRNQEKTRDWTRIDPEIGNDYFHEIRVGIGNVYFESEEFFIGLQV
jgi:hypothetical protein